MPGFDGTGPNGFGPLTGGRGGFCAGARGWYDPYWNHMRPLRLRRRIHQYFPWARGWSADYSAYPSPMEEPANKELLKKDLEYQYELLEKELNSLRSQLETLKTSESSEDH